LSQSSDTLYILISRKHNINNKCQEGKKSTLAALQAVRGESL